MMYTLHYDSPLGGILLAADDVGLTGLWFDGELYFAEGLDPDHTAQKTPILQQAERWLEVYFSGREPGFTPPLHPMGSSFRQAVWELPPGRRNERQPDRLCGRHRQKGKTAADGTRQHGAVLCAVTGEKAAMSSPWGPDDCRIRHPGK